MKGGHDPHGVVDGVVSREHEYVVTTSDVTTALHKLTAWALEGGIVLENLSVSQPSLEDIYLALVGEEA